MISHPQTHFSELTQISSPSNRGSSGNQEVEMQAAHSTNIGCKECPRRFVCRCLKITEEDLVVTLSTQEIRDLKDLRVKTGAGDGCRCCHRRLMKYLEQYAQPSSSSSEPICS